MTFFQAIILGIVQGLTEFLPVSSSGHLVLIPFLLNWNLDPQKAFIFDVLVQLGTLFAVFVYFRKDLLAILKAFFNGIKQRKPFAEADSRLGWFIILATIPAGLIGLLLQDLVEAFFDSPVWTAVFLFLTAILLTVSELWSRKTRELETMTVKDSLIIGLFQAMSIFPGVSRSGATITGGLSQGFKRQSAARFSFLMSIPIMLAAGFLSIIKLIKIEGLLSFLPVLLLGFVIAGIVGYFAIKWFLGYLKEKSLLPFAIYCAVLAIVVIFVAYWR